MSKHTPGPWVVDSEDADLFTQNQSRMWINATGMHIGYVDGPRTSERIANARLIAATPDMYELLDQMVAATNDTANMMSAAYLAETLRDLSGQARQLLAKIEGGRDAA